MENSGLTEETIDRIKAVFAKYKHIESVLIYGSRAMGNYRPASDIDLTLKGKNIDMSLQNKIEFDLDDLMLPCKFDICIYEKITNPKFREHIKKVGKEIYKKEEQQRHNII